VGIASFSIMGIITLAVLAFQVWALVDALMRPKDAYVAADKLTKQAWVLILALSVGSTVLLGSTLLLMVSIVAASVYIVDVKPALVSVTRRR
jgi:RsiW-degrading membrane proteinase PrsW (M82 family)